jgi:hypothetical protein
MNAAVRSTMSRQVNARMTTPVTLRERGLVDRFFGGLELMEPGLVAVPQWRPASELEAKSPAGVGRKTSS